MTIEHSFQLRRGYQTAKEWAREENARPPPCVCGCGGSVQVSPRHRRTGVPRYIHAHHPMGMTKDVQAIRAKGGMTSAQAAAALGIGVTTLLRLEGTVYRRLARTGARSLRIFRPADVSKVRAWLARHGRTMSGPSRNGPSSPK